MASETKKTEKVRETNGVREGRAATDAVARAVTETRNSVAAPAKEAAEPVIAIAPKTDDSGIEIVEAVAKEIASAATEAVEKETEAAEAAFDAGSDIGSKVVTETTAATETIGEKEAEAIHASTEINRRFFAQGMQAAATWHKKFSRASAGQHVLGATSRVLDIYRNASEQTSANARALADSYINMGRGMQALQKTYIELMERAAQKAASRPMDLLRCKSFEEFARVQRDIYVESLNYSVEATGIMLEAANRATQEALKPLHGHHA